MPYITPEQKKKIEDDFSGNKAENPGELNFMITTLILEYIKGKGAVTYQIVNDVVGALECSKQEFYRRIAAPYEEKKIKENGDVY